MQGKRYKPGAEAAAVLQNRGVGGAQQRVDSARPNQAAEGESQAKLQSKLEDFQKLQKLGQGSFGVVYMVKRKQDNKTYVLKTVDT